MCLTSTVINDTTAIFCDTCASEDHYHAVCTEKKNKNVKVLPKPASYSQDKKGTAEKQKAVSSVYLPVSLLQYTYQRIYKYIVSYSKRYFPWPTEFC